MTTRCDQCHAPIMNPKPGQRFCSTPGSTCRQDWHRANQKPGIVKGVRQLASGNWSITVHYPPGVPPIQRGAKVSLETLPSPRPDASCEDNGGSDDDLLTIPAFLRKQAD